MTKNSEMCWPPGPWHYWTMDNNFFRISVSEWVFGFSLLQPTIDIWQPWYDKFSIYSLECTYAPNVFQVYPVTYTFWMKHQAENIREAAVDMNIWIFAKLSLSPSSTELGWVSLNFVSSNTCQLEMGKTRPNIRVCHFATYVLNLISKFLIWLPGTYEISGTIFLPPLHIFQPPSRVVYCKRRLKIILFKIGLVLSSLIQCKINQVKPTTWCSENIQHVPKHEHILLNV